MKESRKPRVILVSGKGGVGKTTLASATGAGCAKRGLRTLVMSIDIAHSLSDSFALDGHLLNINDGMPVNVSENLDIQEVDLQAEMKRHWGDIFASLSALLKSSGMNEVLAEELAILPGMSDVVCLLYISRYIEKNEYDVIILDCAPTGESLRFISMPSTVEWSLRKVYKLKKHVPSIAKPIIRIMGGATGSSLDELEKLQTMYDQLNRAKSILVDDSITSVRLVCNAERMVINETLRAYMYFCLYGMNVDMVAVNRMLPGEANNGYFDNLIDEQNQSFERIENHFSPIKVIKTRMFPEEINGIENLELMAGEMFSGFSPESIYCRENPYQFSKDGAVNLLRVKLPGVGKENVDLFNEKDELVIRIGNFKRHVYLPRAYAAMKPKVANYRDNYLTIRFEKAENTRSKESPSGAGGDKISAKQ